MWKRKRTERDFADEIAAHIESTPIVSLRRACRQTTPDTPRARRLAMSRNRPNTFTNHAASHCSNTSRATFDTLCAAWYVVPRLQSPPS